jgi:acyl-coenzyme A thioesterase PaaI-like protein
MRANPEEAKVQSVPSEVASAVRLLPKTSACYVCGSENASGLHIPFVADGANGSSACYTVRAEHCGWPGLLHGGVAFALMDEALAWACYFQGLYGVTARIETRFRQPLPVGSKLTIRAWTTERRRRLVTARAEIRLDADDQPLVAEADATMYLREIESEPRP